MIASHDATFAHSRCQDWNSRLRGGASATGTDCGTSAANEMALMGRMFSAREAKSGDWLIRWLMKGRVLCEPQWSGRRLSLGIVRIV